MADHSNQKTSTYMKTGFEATVTTMPLNTRLGALQREPLRLITLYALQPRDDHEDKQLAGTGSFSSS